METDDLRLVATLARLSTVAATATELRTHPATIYRQLKGLEHKAGLRLFDRVDARYLPTSLGAEMARLYQDIELKLAEASRRIAGGDAQLTGRIVVTTADSLAPFVTRMLGAFRVVHTELSFDLNIANGMADMTRYEAEVAIRPTRKPPDALVGRLAGTFGYGIYRSRNCTLPDHWITLDGSLASIPSSRWLAGQVSSSTAAIRVNSMWAAAQAASAGLGQALIPDYLGQELGLERSDQELPELNSQIWLLIHPDLRRTAKIRAFLDFAAPFVRANLSGAL